MLYVRNRRGYYTPLTYGNIFARCPQCKTMHQVDLIDLLDDQDLLDSGAALESMSVYCSKCSMERAKLRPNEPCSAQLMAEGRCH